MTKDNLPILTVKDFIGDKAIYDKGCLKIFGSKNNQLQMIADIRGWGAIQHLFKTESEAGKFQDEMGKFIADAITEKLYTQQFHAISIDGKEIAIDFAKYVNVRNWRWNDYSEKWEDRERVHNSITNEEMWNKFLLTRNNK